MLKQEIKHWIKDKKMEVVCRLTLTLLVREPDEIKRKRHRDQGVEYWLDRLWRQGTLSKHRVDSFMAYYIPTGKPGVRGNLAHDLLAGLAAAKLYADLKGLLPVELNRQALAGFLPDWTLEFTAGDKFSYFIEFHSARNSLANLFAKLETYTQILEENELVLVICQNPLFIELPSAQFFMVTFRDLLNAANSWRDPIWTWGGQDGRYSLLSE